MYKRKRDRCISEKSEDIFCEDVKNWHSKHRPKRRIVKKECEDVFGNNVTFYSVSHGLPANCKEYIVAKEAFNFKRWILFMTVFTLLAFYCELYNRDISSLGAIFLFLCFILIVKLHLKVKEESLLVMASLGLQFTTTFVTGRRASQFIDQQNIQDVVLSEGIMMHRVLYYLAVLLKDANEQLGISAIVPLFQNTFPRLSCLEEIYNGVQMCLFVKS